MRWCSLFHSTSYWLLLVLVFSFCALADSGSSRILTEEKIRERGRYSDLMPPVDDSFAMKLWQQLINIQLSFSDLMPEPLVSILSALTGEHLDVFKHHVIDPVRRGRHYLRYTDSVMLGTFDNVLYESTGTTTWPFALVGVPYGMVVKNTVADFKLGSEVRSPGINDSRYHNYPVTVSHLGAETTAVSDLMAQTHQNELVVADVVRPFMPRMTWCDGEDSLAASIYQFYYAATRLVTDVNPVVDFEDTEYFVRNRRYEESDRTFLFHWNKGISRRSSFRSGQIVRVDRNGFFSMGSIPLAWNYCEVLLHEGGAKEVEATEDEEETETFYEHPESYRWGVRSDRMLPRKRTRIVTRQVVKQIPNVTRFRIYTESLCQAAEASVRSKSEVVVFASRRLFSWLVPTLVLLGAPATSRLLTQRYGVGHNFPLTRVLVSGVLLTSWAFPALWESDVADTIHMIRFPPPENEVVQ